MMTTERGVSISIDDICDALVDLTGNEALRHVDSSAQFKDLGIDSLGHFNLLLSLEKQFGFKIPDDKLTFKNVGTIEAVQAVVNEARSAAQGSG